jgi:hypothetical protein
LASSGQQPPRLVLRVDVVRQGQPAGADPFGIRASFDWLEPLVELDAEQVKAETLRRGPRLVPAWQGWKVATENQPGARLVNYWDEATSRYPLYRLMAGGSKPLTLSSTLRIEGSKDQLFLAVNRPPQSSASKIEVRVNGESLKPLEIPVRYGDKPPEPLVVSLEGHQGRQVQMELVQVSADDRAMVAWGAIVLGARPGEADGKNR